MGQELTTCNETLLEFERLIETGSCNPWEGQLRTGVDLGTANIVLEMGYAADMHREALLATGVVLFIFILLINLSFSLLRRRDDK